MLDSHHNHHILSRTTVFFYNDTATTEIYTLSLHDALPISCLDDEIDLRFKAWVEERRQLVDKATNGDRKSTRLNSSHVAISYAVFCLKKKRRVGHVHSVMNRG